MNSYERMWIKIIILFEKETAKMKFLVTGILFFGLGMLIGKEVGYKNSLLDYEQGVTDGREEWVRQGLYKTE